MNKALLYGVLASMFFASTFILNRSMALSGGCALWSAALRFIFMLPMLYMMLPKQMMRKVVYQSITAKPIPWFIWSTVGFGLFYLPLTLASDYGESWLIASSWQLTIIAGVLLTPLFGQRLPVKNLLVSCVIIIGILLLQYENFLGFSLNQGAFSLILVIIAAFSYPLGNRKMMFLVGHQMNTTQRVFGMTLCSLPFWILVSIYAAFSYGSPSNNQLLQSFFVALFSGVIATILFFKATEQVKHNAKKLAVVEATQACEVLFALLGGVFWLHDAIPSVYGSIGIALIIIGIIVNSLASHR